jgi:hypothetical protein
MAHTHQKSDSVPVQGGGSIPGTYVPSKPKKTRTSSKGGRTHTKSKPTSPPAGDPNLVDAGGVVGPIESAAIGLKKHGKLHARHAGAKKTTPKTGTGSGRHAGAKKTSRRNIAAIDAAAQGDYAGKGVYGGVVVLGSPALHRAARHKGSKGTHTTHKAAGHGHTKKPAGASSTTKRHTGGGHSHVAHPSPGTDSRNYTPAAPHPLQPLTHATPHHPHAK